MTRLTPDKVAAACDRVLERRVGSAPTPLRGHP
jgi:hypothetical protein